MSDELNPSALLRFASHEYLRDLPPGQPQVTILAKPPAHLLRRSKAQANVTREAQVYGGWSHRGKARVDGVLLSVWQRPGQWTTTVGAKMPEVDHARPIWASMHELLEQERATQYLGDAKKLTKRKR